MRESIASERDKLFRKVKRYQSEEEILLSYYRIDNVSPNGMPPLYLNPKNTGEYTQRINELESIYRNTAFRELIAWTLNFHANLAVSGKMKNSYGDEIEVPTEHAKHMISGVRAVWELILAAHLKDLELRAEKAFDPFEEEDETVEKN